MKISYAFFHAWIFGRGQKNIQSLYKMMHGQSACLSEQAAKPINELRKICAKDPRKRDKCTGRGVNKRELARALCAFGGTYPRPPCLPRELRVRIADRRAHMRMRANATTPPPTRRPLNTPSQRHQPSNRHLTKEEDEKANGPGTQRYNFSQESNTCYSDAQDFVKHVCKQHFPCSTSETSKDCYLKYAREHHPQRSGGSTEAFQNLGVCYPTTTNPDIPRTTLANKIQTDSFKKTCA